MLHTLVYSLGGVYGPAGDISNDRSELVARAADIAKVAADLLGDYLTILDDDYDTEEKDEDAFESESERVVDQLDSEDDAEREDARSQIGDLLKSKQMGYFDLTCPWSSEPAIPGARLGWGWRWGDGAARIDAADLRSGVIFDCR